MPSRQESAAPGGRNPSVPLKARQDGVALSGKLFDLEARLARVVLRETLLRQREFVTLTNALFRLYAWPFVQSGHMLEIQDIARRSVEFALATQTAFVHSLFGRLAPYGNPASGKPVSGRRLHSERRVSALIIPFPERRVVNR